MSNPGRRTSCRRRQPLARMSLIRHAGPCATPQPSGPGCQKVCPSIRPRNVRQARQPTGRNVYQSISLSCVRWAEVARCKAVTRSDGNANAAILFTQKSVNQIRKKTCRSLRLARKCIPRAGGVSILQDSATSRGLSWLTSGRWVIINVGHAFHARSDVRKEESTCSQATPWPFAPTKPLACSGYPGPACSRSWRLDDWRRPRSAAPASSR